MRRFAALILAIALSAPLLMARPIAAQELSAGDRNSIQSIIEGQISAFKRDDAAKAFGYATPELRSQFGDSAEMFMRMVQAGYAPVYRPRDYQFRDLKPVNGVVTQQLYVVGPDGEPRLALYFMQKQPDGSWLISGCVLLDFDGQRV